MDILAEYVLAIGSSGKSLDIENIFLMRIHNVVDGPRKKQLEEQSPKPNQTKLLLIFYIIPDYTVFDHNYNISRQKHHW